MLSPIVSGRWLSLVALTLVVSGAVGSLLPSSGTTYSPFRSEKVQSKLAKLVDERFDEPDLAAEFYANSRTGPLLTRGPNPTTGVRPLSASAYLPALQQMRGMPRFSSATNAVLPSYAADPDLNAGPGAGAALGTWSNLGPSNQGGRTRALLIDPANPNTMYAGGVGGGVWKSTNAGATWTPLGDFMANIAVSTLVFDPQNSSIIYAGTGEGFGNIDAIRGAGIFKSTDAGVTWNQIPSTNNSTFHYTMSIVVSPRDSQRLFAATRTGLLRSTNGGTSWSTVVSNASGGCTQVVLQPAGASGFVFTSCGNFSQGTVHRGGDDNVSTFSSVLSQAGQGRSSLAIAPSSQAVVYVMAAQATNGGGPGVNGLHGIYRSTSNGDPGSFTTQVSGTVNPTSTAQKINQLLLSNPVIALLTECGDPTASFYSNQGWYDNVIAVDPLDANRVWAGGIDLFRSDDGGATWGAAGYWWIPKGSPQYHHADQHGIVFHPQYNGTSNKVMFSTSDGGIDRIDDARAPVNTTLNSLCGTPVAGSPTWVDRNSGYVTTQFYDGAAYPNGQTFFGGLQDNGTQRGVSGNANWSTLAGGDGGYVAVDTLGDGISGNDVLFSEYTRLSIQRSVNGGVSFSSAISGINENPTNFLFIAPFAMNPAFKQHLWTGGWAVWRTTSQASAWAQASAVACGLGSVSAIAAHPLDASRVLVGMSDGCYHYSHAALFTNGGSTWQGGSVIAGGYISWMAWDPTDINVAYATVSAFGVTNLLKTTNGGQSWSPRVGSGATALPQIPALTVVVNPSDSQQVYVGTDLGVFTSIDGGASWLLENTGFANVPVEALKINETAPHHVYAFTHGRGAWRVTIGTTGPTAGNDAYNTAHNTTLNVGAPGVLGNDNANGGGTMSAVLESTTASGTLTLNLNGSFTFVPANGSSGPVKFTYRASNGGGVSNVATVTITVDPAPTAPTAVNDSYTTPQNTTLNVAAPGVLSNDSVNGGGTLTAVLESAPASGVLTLNPNGSFSFIHAYDFSGPVTFTYRASNGNALSNVATVTIDVAGIPPTFLPHPSSHTAYAGQSTYFFVGVLGTPRPTCQWQASVDLGASWANLSNVPPYGGATTTQLTISAATTALSGTQYRCLASNPTATVASNAATLTVATIAGTPQAGAFAGLTGQSRPISVNVSGSAITQLQYQWSACGISATSTVTGQIPIVNNVFSTSSPVAQCGQAYTTGTFTSPTNASGTLVLSFTSGQPGCTCSGTAVLGWAMDRTTPSAPQVLVHPANQTPAAGQRAQFAAAFSGSPLPTLQWEVLQNGGASWGNVPATSPFSGANSPTLTVIASGLASLNNAQFRLRAQNGSGNITTNPATLQTMPAAVPTAVADAYGTPFATTRNVAAPGVLGNDTSNGGGAMTAQLMTSASNGVVSLNADGSFSYTPNAGFSGGDSFTYRASNSVGPGNTVAVTITVGIPSGEPISTNDSYATGHNAPLIVTSPGVLGNDDGRGGGPMTAAVVSTTSNGSLSLAGDGSFTYTPTSGFSGVDTFTYRASNPSGPGNVATVSITVAGPGVPVAPSDFRIIGMSGNNVTFAWTLPTSGPTPTAIQLEGGLTPGSVLGALPLGVTPSATIALPTGSFFIRLRAIAGGAVSGPSNELFVNVNVPVKPSPPANLLGLVNGSAVQLAWTPTFGGGEPTGALLDVTGTLSATLPLGAGDTFTFPAVPPGTYTFRMRQTNAGGASDQSSPVTLTFPGGCSGAPQPATKFFAYKAGGMLFLHWDPPASGAAPSTYLLNVSGSFVGTFPMGGRSFSVAAPPGTFTFSIVATNACGASAPTATQTVSFP